MILGSQAPAYADGAHNLSVALEWNAAGEDHDPAVVGNVYAEELIAALRIFGQSLGFDVKGAGRERFIHGDVDASNPGSLHAFEGHEICSRVDNRNVHRDTNFGGFLLAAADDIPRLLKRDSKCLACSFCHSSSSRISMRTFSGDLH